MYFLIFENFIYAGLGRAEDIGKDKTNNCLGAKEQKGSGLNGTRKKI